MLSSLASHSGAEPVDPSQVQFLISVSESVTTQYINVALLAILTYHSIITMDKEVKYFWRNPSNIVSLSFFANRYIGLLCAACHIFIDSLKVTVATYPFVFWTISVTTLTTIVLLDYILLIRVLALYHQNRKVDICLKILLGLEAAAGLGLIIYGNIFEEITTGSLAEGLVVCGLGRYPPEALIYDSWSIPLAYGLVLLSLALYKAAEYWRQSSGLKGLPLVKVLIRDQVIYFGFVISCCILRIVQTRIVIVNPFISDILNVVGSSTLLCVLGGQLLINLKEAGERGANGGTNYWTESINYRYAVCLKRLSKSL